MEQRKTDIFDKIFGLSLFRWFKPIYSKYRELLLYLFFGVLTFIVSIVSYSFFLLAVDLNELIANILSWIFAVSFAYITNKTWVFNSNAKDLKTLVSEIVSFSMGRVITLIVEEIILFIFITLLQYNSMIVKIIAQIIVIILNYVISKLLVFGNRNEKV